MSCKGLHCPGCGDGGGAGLAVLAVVAVILGLVLHAIWHTLVEVVEIIALILLSGLGLAAAGGLVYAGLRIRASVRARRPRAVIPARAEAVQPGRQLGPAIEAPRPQAARWPLAGQWADINPRTDRRSS
jgi:hypothetical protein